jgi:hypothetical protein
MVAWREKIRCGEVSQLDWCYGGVEGNQSKGSRGQITRYPIFEPELSEPKSELPGPELPNCYFG